MKKLKLSDFKLKKLNSKESIKLRGGALAAKAKIDTSSGTIDVATETGGCCGGIIEFEVK